MTFDLAQGDMGHSQKAGEPNGSIRLQAQVSRLAEHSLGAQFPLGVDEPEQGRSLAELALPADDQVQPARAAAGEVERGRVGGAAEDRLAHHHAWPALDRRQPLDRRILYLEPVFSVPGVLPPVGVPEETHPERQQAEDHRNRGEQIPAWRRHTRTSWEDGRDRAERHRR
jgi:hypothetical protein